jgi:hypothetical protein
MPCVGNGYYKWASCKRSQVVDFPLVLTAGTTSFLNLPLIFWEELEVLLAPVESDVIVPCLRVSS